MAGLHILYELLGCLALVLTLPLVLELLVLSIASRLPGKTPAIPACCGDSLRLWTVIPAHNEEVLIATCVRSLLAANEPPAGVLVVAHNCTDATAGNAQQAGASILPVTDDGAGGKGAALQAGFEAAFARGADAVLVIDADSIVSTTLPGAVSAHLQAGADAVQCRYLAAEPGASPRSRLMSLAFLGMNLIRPLGRYKLGLSCGIFGNGFALRRSTIATVPYVARSVVEDLEYHLLLLRAGLKVQFLNGATVLGEMPNKSAAAATQRARWEGGRSHIRRRWSGTLLRDVLRGRLGMMEPLLDLLTLPLATGATLLLLALLVPITWVRLYAATGLISFMLYVLMSASFATKPLATLRALLSVPAYLLWKLINLPRTRLAARRNAVWARTERNQTADTSRTAPPPPPSL